MKRLLLGVLIILAIVFCGISQLSNSPFAKLDNLINPPNTFSSEKELKKNLLVNESQEYEAPGKKFFVCLSSFPSAGSTEDRVTCWYHLPNSEKLLRVWDVRLVDAGIMKFDYDTKTTRLSVVTLTKLEVENTPMQGQTLASVILSLLGTHMAGEGLPPREPIPSRAP